MATLLSLPADVFNYMCDMDPTIVFPRFRLTCRGVRTKTARSWQRYKESTPVTRKEQEVYLLSEVVKGIEKTKRLVHLQAKTVALEAERLAYRQRFLSGLSQKGETYPQTTIEEEEEYEELLEEIYEEGSYRVCEVMKLGSAPRYTVPTGHMVLNMYNTEVSFVVEFSKGRHKVVVERNEKLESAALRIIKCLPPSLLLPTLVNLSILLARGLTRTQAKDLYLAMVKKDVKECYNTELNGEMKNPATTQYLRSVSTDLFRESKAHVVTCFLDELKEWEKGDEEEGGDEGDDAEEGDDVDEEEEGDE